jgi:hypothetical protein
MTTLVTSSGTITLPDDMLWPDEFKWTPVAQQWDISLGGSQIIEISTQSFGRPITLIGDPEGPWVDATTMDALRAAEIAQGDTPMTLTLPDGRTFSVLFFGSGSTPAVDGDQVVLRAAQNSTERAPLQFIPTIRMKQVG